MKNYIDFTIEELVLDAYFRKWATNQLPIEDTFWQEFLAKNPTQKDKLKVASEIVRSLEIVENDLSDEEVTQEVKRIFQIAVEKKPTKIVPIVSQYWMRIAAAVVFTVGIGWYFINKKLSEPLISIPSGQHKVVEDNFIHLVNDGETAAKYTLLDSTKLTLKKKSELSYPKRFAADKREVFLKGEAYFSVAKDATRPFIIHTDKIETKVLGTKFKVRAYEEEKNISVSVNEGKVSVAKENTTKIDENSGVILNRNQSVIFDKKTGKFTKFTTFKSHKLNDFFLMEYNFNQAHLANVFEEFEKEYDVLIIYDAEKIKDCYITAVLKNTTFYKVLDYVCKESNSEYEIFDGKILVKSKGCK